MRLTLLRWSLTVSVALVAFGCGDAGEADNDNDNERQNQNYNDPANQLGNSGYEQPEVTAEDFEEASMDTLRGQCEKIFECCGDDEFAGVVGETDLEDVDDCIEAKSGLFGHGGTEMSEAYQNERIDFQEAQIEVCIASIETMSCEDFDATDSQRRGLPGCRSIAEPLVEEGEVCDHDWECKTGFCRSEELGEEGECATEPDEVGQDCPSLRCGPGLYCETMSAECLQELAVGEECDEDRECGTGYCGEEVVGEGEDEEVVDVCQQRGEQVCTGE